jgi:hypothetical protein
MPPLELFGYSMFFAGDDMHLLSFVGIIVRCIQVGFLIPSFLYLMAAMHDSNAYYETYHNSISIRHTDDATLSSLSNNQTTTTMNETMNETIDDLLSSLLSYDNQVQSSQTMLLVVFILSLSTAVISIPIEIAM